VPVDLGQLAGDGVPVHQERMEVKFVQVGELAIQLQQQGGLGDELLREAPEGLVLLGHRDGHLLVAGVPIPPRLIQRRHVELQAHREARGQLGVAHEEPAQLGDGQGERRRRELVLDRFVELAHQRLRRRGDQGREVLVVPVDPLLPSYPKSK